MTQRFIILFIAAALLVPGLFASEIDPMFTSFPEVTEFGDFLCGVTFWRGLPPCLKETFIHGGYAWYPTREKAKIIIDAWLHDGLYERELLVAYFGSLCTGHYRPVPSVTTGTYWDSAYFALVKLDYRIEAKRMLMDIVLDRDWAKGKFPTDRYKALKVLAKERLITLREYEALKTALTEELQKPEPDFNWVSTIIDALSSFREWGDELLPLFRDAYNKAPDGRYEIILQTFLDFEIPDDAEVIIQKFLDGKVQNFEDQKIVIRCAYVLDDEHITPILKDVIKKDDLNPELKSFIENSIERLEWFGSWEITDSKDTWDAGLEHEKIAFRMKNSMHDQDDIVNFSMIMQLNDPIELKPIGMDDTFESNYVSFVVTPEELIFTIYNPFTRTSEEKRFTLKDGTGRNEGKLYLKFPVEGITDKKGNQKFGFVEIEKIG